MTVDELIDLELRKKQAGLDYVRRRRALRLAVSLGLPKEIVREVKAQVIEHKTIWTLIYRELKRL